MKSPAYFEAVRDRAARRWDQLEADPELAGPWHQLFKQVQSPRHVLSELLQNADDAGATEAKAWIKKDTFYFTHNGEDFTEEHFRSLCRFGYSNKRALHTIGFRGIGFKSTFSLGPRVQLQTPTLSVAFEKRRFTEPKWMDEAQLCTDGLTRVRVAIKDQRSRAEIERNLEDWLESPVSLLFFKNIRRIEVGDSALHWDRIGDGPIPESEWMALNGDHGEPYLKARSGLEQFPAEALAEIRDARMLAADDEMEFPPCAVEIVLGKDDRLFVVLPTEVETGLPFACNAPFMQDPTRTKIPATATNAWLLTRIGRLAAEVMLASLSDSAADLTARARAYDLMPDVDREDKSPAGSCAAMVELAFADAIDDKDILLTDRGELKAANGCIVLPQALFDVWPGEQAAALFDDDARPPLSPHVSAENLEKLVHWRCVENIGESEILAALRKHGPRPKSWRNLLALWRFVESSLTGYVYRSLKGSLCIVPVQAQDVLHAANEVVRLGEKKLLANEDDWQFLGDGLPILNQNWLRYLTEQRRLADSTGDEDLAGEIEAADTLLETIGLNAPSDANKVLDRVAADFFAKDSVELSDAIRLAQIGAKLGVTAGEAFHFVCQDGYLRSTSETILFDPDGDLGLLIPEDWAEEHFLHPDYFKAFKSCSREEWLKWLGSGRAGMHGFVPLQQTCRRWLQRPTIDAELRRRGYTDGVRSRYSNPSFNIDDWDFPAENWKHWDALAKDDPGVWGKIAERVLTEPRTYWAECDSAEVSEIASNGHVRGVIRSGLAPAWIMKLREKPCLRDTHGKYHKPAELLRRTPETESLMDVELFIHGLLDNENTRPLLKLLAVGDTPTGPDKLLARLRTLAIAGNAPAYEVEKWYRRLDQMIGSCTSDDFAAIKKAFGKDRLIFTQSGQWEAAAGVFLTADEDEAPGAETIRDAVADLTMWHRIGVADRPTADLALKWLGSLPSHEALSQDDARRARNLLKRYPQRVWNECGHWLSLSGEWTPAEELEYGLTMQTLIPWSHLHQWVKQKTAELQGLSVELAELPPFSGLPPLAAHIEERFHSEGAEDSIREEKPWLRQLGGELQRIVLDEETETGRIRALGERLASTAWVIVPDLETIPYIDGKPAGTPRRAEAMWLDEVLYVENRSMARLARAVAQELGRAFRRGEIIDAIKLCFDHSASFVSDYMEENFDLTRQLEIEITEPAPAAASETPDEEPEEAVDDSDAADYEEEDDADDAPDADEPLDDEADEEDEEGVIGDEDTHERTVRKPKPARPNIMERLALSYGFRKDGDNRFYDGNGSWISKSNDGPFPWERKAPHGAVLARYWAIDHCLEREPLQVPAEVWSILEKHPDSYVLVVARPDGNAMEISGKRLREMRDDGEITLHPATYRLVYEHDADL